MKFRLIFCLTILMPVALWAQNTVDYDLYMDAAGMNSILFRGAFPMRHGILKPSDGSTFFAYSVNFEPGVLIFCGKPYAEVLLNLNASTDELYVANPAKIPILVNRQFVDSFSMGRHQFVHYEPEENSPLKEGYYEVLYAGKVLLYKKIQKQLREDINYGDKVVQKYLLTEVFYVKKNDRWYRVRNKTDLKKLFPEQKKTINQIVRTKALDFGINKGWAFIEILVNIDHP